MVKSIGGHELSKLLGIVVPDSAPQEVYNACMNYRHDFGLLSEAEKQQIVFEAREWLSAWLKVAGSVENKDE
jgi:hypothetical protein